MYAMSKIDPSGLTASAGEEHTARRHIVDELGHVTMCVHTTVSERDTANIAVEIKASRARRDKLESEKSVMNEYRNAAFV